MDSHNGSRTLLIHTTQIKSHTRNTFIIRLDIIIKSGSYSNEELYSFALEKCLCIKYKLQEQTRYEDIE